MNRYLFVGRIAARQQWVYRREMLMRAVSMVLFMGVFMALWITVFQVGDAGSFAGFTLPEVVWYLAMTETITLSSSRLFVEISEAVKSGDLAYTLTRPIPYPFFQVASSLGNSAPRFLLNLVTASSVVSLGLRKLPILPGGVGAGSLAGLGAFLLMAGLALFLDALVAVLIGLAAFWMEEVMPIFWIYQKLLFTVGGLFLPLEFFPGWLRRISLWLPFRFIANAPARAFVKFELSTVGMDILGQLAYILVLLLVVILVWRAARRRLVVNGG